jgi:hypothetical protein
MKLLEKAKSGVVRKVLFGVALLGGFLAFLGAGTASARPRVVVGFGGPMVVGGYYAAPRPIGARHMSLDPDITTVTTRPGIVTGMRGCVAGANGKS